MTVRFDAYSATTLEAKNTEILHLLSQCGDMHDMHQGKGFHTFGERVGVKNDQGIEWASVQWGGRQGERVMLEVKGESTPKVVEAFRERYQHRCTRVDACADFDASGAFNRLLDACLTVKAKHQLLGERQGDWEDFPERGRTLYLGARKSVTRVRLYEKGRQPEYRHLEKPDWVRIEVQVRPAKDAKASFSTITPFDAWGASTWTRELAASVLQEHIDPHPAGTVYRRTSTDAAISWMCQQYGAHLLDLANALGGWDCVGLTLGEIIKEQASKKPN
jgi:DNA relaxase NicK